MNTKKICEVCESDSLVKVLDLGSHPLCDDLLKIGSNEKCAEYKIEIAFCKNCLTAHQIHPVPKDKLFPKTYHYRSSLTQDVLNGMQNLVNSAHTKLGGLTDKVVLDIGCNDGSLLNLFQQKGAKVLGVEPTGAANDAIENGIRVLNAFFDSNIASQILEEVGYPDVITFTNVFAHIEDLNALLDAVQILMGDKTCLIIENHYLGAVLDRFQFDTFYHEHPRTYSAHSFVEVAKKLNRNIESIEFPSRYGGNIRVFIGGKKPSADQVAQVNKALESENNFLHKFEVMRATINVWHKSILLTLENLKSAHNKIYCKAFPGRAAILIKILNLSEHDIAGVFEKPNSPKIGHYIPGTKIPILSENLMHSLAPPPQTILNLAWHISDEIQTYIKNIDPRYECIDIFDPERDHL